MIVLNPWSLPCAISFLNCYFSCLSMHSLRKSYNDFSRQIKLEPSDSPEPRADMIQLPTEYGSLPADYGLWIPKA